MFKRFSDLFYEITVGLVKEYQSKALDLAKIEAAALYVKGVKSLREHVVMAVMVILGTLVLAFAIVTLPLALILCQEWTVKMKMAAIGGLGVVYIGVPVAVMMRFLSEKKWMKASKCDELLEKLVGR